MSESLFSVATTQSVPVQVVLTTDAAGAPLRIDDVVFFVNVAGRTLVYCTQEEGVGRVCDLGVVSPQELRRVAVEVFAPSTDTIGSIGSVHASVRPVPGNGAGLTGGSTSVGAEILPHTELSTSVMAVERDATGAAVVPVGEERAITITVYNAGPDAATDVTTTLDVGRFAGAFSFSRFDPAADVVRTGPREATWTVEELPIGRERILRGWLTPVTVPIANDGRPTSEILRWTTSAVGEVATCAAHANEVGHCSYRLQATPWPGTDGVPGSVDDVNGEGFADAVGIRHDGSLWYYPNELAAGGALPFGYGVRIGSGWQGFIQATTGDVTSDGAADIVATDSGGTLWLYKNRVPNGASPGQPYSTGVRIGSGWKRYSQVATGDVNGDGAADLVATGPDGRLWYYPNNSASNPGRVPYMYGTQIGSGWGGFLAVQAADVNGDGDADLLATAPNGDLRLYENNRLTNPGGLPYRFGDRVGTSWNIFRLLL